MVLKLKFASPAKFYGSSLPRPRIYTDVKFNEERVDPPVPVLDPLLSWANEAHWSMGGLSFKRLRLQGRIEGNVSKLRIQDTKERNKRASSLSDSPPPAPVASKRRRFLALIDEDDDDEVEEEEDLEAVRGKRLVKKLAVELDRVAAEEEETVASRTRSRKLGVEEETETVMQVAKDVNKMNLKGRKLKKRSSKGPRTSPRLA